MPSARDREPEVVRVTTARHSHTEDIALRQRRYAIMQSFRIACVLLGVLLPIPIWAKGLFFIGAVALPWCGVVMANAGPSVASRKSRRNAIQSGLTETSTVERVPIERSRIVDG
jgi:hypothetical protein